MVMVQQVYTGCVKSILENGSQLVCMMPNWKQMHIQRLEHASLRLILRVPKWTNELIDAI